MWQRVKGQVKIVEDMSKEQQKKVYLELLALQ